MRVLRLTKQYAFLRCLALLFESLLTRTPKPAIAKALFEFLITRLFWRIASKGFANSPKRPDRPAFFNVLWRASADVCLLDRVSAFPVPATRLELPEMTGHDPDRHQPISLNIADRPDAITCKLCATFTSR
jgi:hypothetical protein